MKNYQEEQDKNYDKTKKMFERCRKAVSASNREKEELPVVNDDILFSDIPEDGVCITSQFDNGLCGEIIWCRSGNDVYMFHSSIRFVDHTVWFQMSENGKSEALHLKLMPRHGEIKEPWKQEEEFSGIYILPFMQVKQFYDVCFWPNYLKGKKTVQEDKNLYKILKRIVKCIGCDFEYDLETMQI